MSTSVLVQPVNSPDDFAAVYHCIREAFVRQIRDSIWISMNPEWGPPEGQKEGASKLLRRWQSVTKNKEGQPNTIILKASVPNPQDETKHKIMGAAIWSQTSFVDGHGDRPTDSPADVAALSDTEKRFASQMYRSLWKRRVALAREKACSDSPAMFTLYTWAVDPAFQRRGVAGKLVEWGLQEAKRRGGLECTTEALPMGRTVYIKFGFRAEGAAEDLVYEVNEEFRHRDKPAILFMRTGASWRHATLIDGGLK